MKKKLVILMGVFAASLVLNAAPVMAGGMNYSLSSPTLTTDSTTATDMIECKTAAKTVTGSNTWTKFGSYGSLSSKFGSGSREMEIVLMELDQKPNADDKVKKYKASFSGRVLTSISRDYIYSNGSIDSSGDQIAELYLSIKIDAISGDKTRSVPSGLFAYRYGIH